MKEQILAEIDKYLKNCEEAAKDGAMSQFGSAGGPMMLKSAEDAFKALRKFVEDLHE